MQLPDANHPSQCSKTLQDKLTSGILSESISSQFCLSCQQDADHMTHTL